METGRESRMTRMKSLIFALIIIAAGLAVFANTFNNDFVYDDMYIIKDNQFITDLSNVRYMFSREYFSRSLERTYRPMVTLSYMVDYARYGLRPGGYHISNALWHILTALLVWRLLRRLMPDGFAPEAAALVYLIHPVNSEAINAVGFREDLMTAAFAIGSLLFLVRSVKARGRVMGVIDGILAALFCLFALLSKEMAASLPLLALLVYWLFLRRDLDGPGRKRFLWGFISIAVITFIFVILRLTEVKGPYDEGDPYMGGSFWVSMWTTSRILIYYIRLFLVPWPLKVYYDLEYSYSFLDPKVIGSILLIVGLLVLAVYLSRRAKPVSLGIGWFFISILPVANIIPHAHPIAERYLYLPSAGFAVIAGWLIALLWQKARDSGVKWRRPVLALVLCAVAGGYIAAALTRGNDWRDGTALWYLSVRQTPESADAHINYGKELLDSGFHEEAMAQFRSAIRLDERSALARFNLGTAHSSLAQKLIREARKIMETTGNPVQSNRKLREARGQFDLAIEELEMAIAWNPWAVDVYMVLGEAYFAVQEAGYNEKAYKYLMRAMKLEPENPKPYAVLGNLFLEAGRNEDAIFYYRKSLERNMNQGVVHFFMAEAYEKIGDLRKAYEHLQIAAGYMPDDSQVQSRLEKLGKKI